MLKHAPIHFCLLIWTFTGFAQTFSETIDETMSFAQLNESSLLQVYNFHGDIHIEGYDGSEVEISLKRNFSARAQSFIDRAKKELTLIKRLEGDTMFVGIEIPWEKVNPYTRNGRIRSGFWHNNKYWNPPYEFRMDFTIRVPRKLHLMLHTVNEGDIQVRNVSGDMIVSHINGDITLENITGTTDAHTINGDIKLEYQQFPAGDSRYFTHNGDIEAVYPKNLKAKIYFSSSHGEFFTNIDDTDLTMEQIILKDENTHGGKGIEYRIDGKTALNVRNGQRVLDFETYNGDVYVREQ